MAGRAARGVLWITMAAALATAWPAGAQLAQDAAMTPTGAADLAYRLGSGDKVRITVYNEETVTGEYEIDDLGNLSLPLIGTVPAVGRTMAELRADLEAKLRDGFMKNPSVAMEVTNYRPFYVLGEVKQPGKYPYVTGMTALKAIALAGGYTYRGKQRKVIIIRATDPDRKSQDMAPTASVMPGDIIRVPERVF